MRATLFFLIFHQAYFSIGQPSIEDTYFKALKNYYQGNFKVSYGAFNSIKDFIVFEHIPLFVNAAYYAENKDVATKLFNNYLTTENYISKFTLEQFNQEITNGLTQSIAANNQAYLIKYSHFEFVKELINRNDIDQLMRDKFSRNDDKKSIDSLIAVDNSNVVFLNKILLQIDKTNVLQLGNAGLNALFTLTQHSKNQSNRILLLKILQNLDYPTKESDILKAYLYDRICTENNIPQLFGTQFLFNGSELEPYPILSHRLAVSERHRMNLLKIEDQILVLQHLYNIKKI